MNEWINPGDQLPKMEQVVIITDGVRPWVVMRYNGITEENPHIWISGKARRKIFVVKYWMPKAGALPPVPEENSPTLGNMQQEGE